MFLGGWWKVSQFNEIHGSIAIEYGEQSFIQSLDNGLFKCGNSHGLGKNILYQLKYVFIIIF